MSKSLRIIFLFLFFIPVELFAVQIIHENGKVILRTETCQELKEQVSSIIKWNIFLGEKSEDLVIDCENDPSRKSIDVFPILPLSIKKIYNIFPVCEGPNCWNAALVGAKLMWHPRFCSEAEWSHYLSQDCRQIQEDENPQAGDLIAIRKRNGTGSFEEIHGFVFINDELVWSKNGLDTNSSGKLHTSSYVRAVYKVNDEKNCINPAKPFLDKCPIFINYFRCKLSSVHNDQNDAISQTLDSMISRCVMNGDLELKELKYQFQKIKKYINSPRVWSYKKQICLMEDHLPFSRYYLCNFFVRKKDKAGLRNFLASGADLNYLDGDGRSPLHEASLRGDLDLVRFLIDQGANIEIIDISEDTPLHSAAKKDQFAVVKYLIEKGANSYATNQSNLTPLQVAAKNGSLQNVIYFVQQLNMNPNLVSPKGLNALHLSAKTGHDDVIEYLIEIGVELEKGDTYDRTPLSYAAMKANVSTIKLLIQKGANKDHQDEDGQTPLMYAVKSKGIGAIEILLESGVDKEIQDDQGCTALFHAVKAGSVDAVALLFNFGANTRHKDNNGSYPLDYAIRSGHRGIINILLSPEMLNGAIYKSIEYSQSKLLELLLAKDLSDFSSSDLFDILEACVLKDDLGLLRICYMAIAHRLDKNENRWNNLTQLAKSYGLIDLSKMSRSQPSKNHNPQKERYSKFNSFLWF